MESRSAFDSLTEEQQLQVYELMGIANIEDINTATKLYIDSNFDTNRAVHRWLDRQTGMNAEPANPVDLSNNNGMRGLRNPLLQNQDRNQENDPSAQYRTYLERRTREEEEKGLTGFFVEKLGDWFWKVKDFVVGYIPVFIRGEREGGEQFINYLWKNARNFYGKVRFNYGTFQENVTKAQKADQPLLVFLFVRGNEFLEQTNRLFSHTELVSYSNSHYQILGLLGDTTEGQKMSQYVEERNWPFVGIFRMNLVGEPTLIESMPLTNDTTPGSVLELIRNSESNFQLIMREEENIRRDTQRSINEQRRRNMLINNPFFPAGQFEEDEYQGFISNRGNNQRVNTREENERLEEARILRQIQDEEYKEVERKILEQQQAKEQEERIIRESQEKAKQLETQRLEEERQKKEKEEFKKKVKLQSLPPEPEESDETAIQFVFRLPDGNRIERRFRPSDTAQTLYDFVDTKDVQFDPTTKRYDLMQPRPFLCLDDMNKPLGEYFEGSNQEVITVREHAE